MILNSELCQFWDSFSEPEWPKTKKNNPLGVAAGQLKNDTIRLVSYFTCYLPCPRTAFPVFYLSLPSYLFVHSRTCSSLFEYIKKWDDMGSVNLAILFVFIGCGSNVFFLEHLINLDPTRNRFKCNDFIIDRNIFWNEESGNLITCCQFLFIALERLAHFKWELKIPLKRHLLLVSLFVTGTCYQNRLFIKPLMVQL